MDYELEPVSGSQEKEPLPGSRKSNQTGSDYVLPASILVAGLMISASILYAIKGPAGGGGAPLSAGNGGDSQLAAAAVNVGGDFLKLTSRDVIMGDPKAPVTLIEYGDYQCPFCGRFFTQIEPQLRENYIKNGKVRMVFRNLQFLGPESTKAAEAAECANDQNKFWAYHDALYTAEIADGRENNGNLARNLFVQLAGNLKLDMKAFASCLDGNKYEKRIAQDTSAAQAAGANSTPTSFVNGQKIQGALPYAQFAAAIDAALKSK